MLLRLFADSTRARSLPDSTRVAESSGYPALDSAALAGAAALRFAPARRHGRPVAGAVPAAGPFPESPDPERAMTPPHLRPYDSVLETIGWTPLIRLARIGAGLRTPIYGKAEYANPGRLGQGPDRARDHRGRGAAGRAPRRAARSWRARAATPASGSRSRPRSRATAASSPCPTRCRRRRCGCSRPTAPRWWSRPPRCRPIIPTTT